MVRSPIEAIKGDMLNLAQTVHCGGCHNSLNFGGNMKAYTIKDRKYNNQTVEGILCEDCQQFENKVKEGPLVALVWEGDTLREIPVNNLPLEETGDELAFTGEGVPVLRTSKGKLKKLGKDDEEAVEPGAFRSGLSRPEIEAKTGSRREK